MLMCRKISLGLCLLVFSGCAAKSKAVYRPIYTSNHDYVKLMKEVDVKTGESLESIYEHPQNLTQEQFKHWLGAIYFEQYNWSSFGFDNKWVKKRVFEAKAIDELAPQLVRAFSQAGASDIVQFSITDRSGDNSGKMWIKDNQWVCELYQIDGYGFKGKDSTRLDNNDWRLVESKGLTIAHDRARKCFTVGIDLGTDLSQLQQVQTQTQQPEAENAPPPSPASYKTELYHPSAPNPQLQTTDQKMRLLKQWLDDGIITKKQYEQKVNSLIEGL